MLKKLLPCLLLLAACRTAGRVAPEALAPAPAPAVDGELSDMYVKNDSLEVVFKNTGRQLTHIVGEVQVQTPNDSLVTTIPLEDATVSVGATRYMRVPMPKLPRGKYVLMAIVDFGGEQLTTVQAELEMR